jgi:hypothetical protein
MNARKILIRAVPVVIGLPVVLVLLAFGFFYSVFYFPNWTSATTGTIVSSAEKREYLLYVPKSYDRTKPTPLVIMADLAVAREEWAGIERGMRELLEALAAEAAGRRIEYLDFRGNHQSDVLSQIVQHVVNHGSYHRGQVTTMLRQLGVAPPRLMDMIVYYRERRQGA